MENPNDTKFTVTKQYIVISRDYEENGAYDEDIIGTTEDLQLANSLADKEARHQEEVYNMKLVDKRYSTYNAVAYKLTTSRGFITGVFVRRVNHFVRDDA